MKCAKYGKPATKMVETKTKNNGLSVHGAVFVQRTTEWEFRCNECKKVK